MKNKSLLLAACLVSILSLGCKGQKGDPGQAGGGRIVATLNCAGHIHDANGSIPELENLYIEYNAVLTAGGDVYASANISDETNQASATNFYAAGQNGSSTATVEITDDYIRPANGGYWNISLNRTTLITSVVYRDDDLSGPVNMTFTPSACTVGNY